MVCSLEHPCDECAAPYGYKHMMTLSQNTPEFSVSECVSNTPSYVLTVY